MIKANRPINKDIFQNGYKNPLKTYHTNQQDYRNKSFQIREPYDRVNSQASMFSHARNLSSIGNSRQDIVDSIVDRNQNRVQAQSQVQRFPSQNPSRIIKKQQLIRLVNQSQVSETDNQLQTLNRLRQQYQILKQVTSQELDKNNNHQQESFEQSEVSKIKISKIKRNKLPIKINTQSRSHKYKQESSQKQQQNELIKKQLQQFKKTYQQQIIRLQHLLSVSSIKIEQLLLQNVKHKQDIKQLNKIISQDQTILTENQTYKIIENQLKIQLNIQSEQTRRLQIKFHLLKEDNIMLQNQSQFKDKQISFLHLKLKQQHNIYSNGQVNISKHQYRNLQKIYNQTLQKLKQERLNRKQQNRLFEKPQIQNFQKGYSLKYQKQLNDQVQLYKKKTFDLLKQMQQLNKKNRQFQLELKLQHSKNQTLQQNLTNLINQLKTDIDKQNLSNKYESLLTKFKDIQQQNHIKFNQQILKIKQQIHNYTIHKFNQQKQSQQLQTNRILQQQRSKIRQLQEIINNQNIQKLQFFNQVTKIKQDYNKLRQQSSFIKKHNLQLEQQIKRLKSLKQPYEKSSKIHEIQPQTPTFWKNQKQGKKLIQKLHQRQQELTSLKKERQTQIQQLHQQIHQLQLLCQKLQHKLRQYQKQLYEQRSFNDEVSEQIHDKQIKMMELLEISRNSNVSIPTNHYHIDQKWEIKLHTQKRLFFQQQIQLKQTINKLKQQINQLKLKLSQTIIQSQQIVHIKQSQNEKLKQNIQNLNQLLIVNEGKYNQMAKSNSQQNLKQYNNLRQQLFLSVKQKQYYQTQIFKLKSELKQLIIKQKLNTKLTANLNHLWQIKNAQYSNAQLLLKQVIIKQ